MQKTKLILASGFLLAFCASALAETATNKSVPALSAGEEVIQAPAVKEKTTIGRLSQKQLELYELELDAKIADVKSKTISANTTKSVGSSLPLPPISVNPINGSSMEPDYQLSAVYGKTSDLQAEVTVDGRPFNVRKGSINIPGWRVDAITSDHVALSNGKKTKNVYLSAQAPTTVGQNMLQPVNTTANGNAYPSAAPISMPPMPVK